MLDAPLQQRVEDGIKRLRVRCELVPHAAVRWRQGSATDEAIGLKLTQLLAQNLCGHARHRALQLAEAQRPCAKSLQDHRLPSPADYADRRVKRTVLPFAITVGSLLRFVASHGYFKVPTCPLRVGRIQSGA